MDALPALGAELSPLAVGGDAVATLLHSALTSELFLPMQSLVNYKSGAPAELCGARNEMR